MKPISYYQINKTNKFFSFQLYSETTQISFEEN